jgi:hypothetical protein
MLSSGMLLRVVLVRTEVSEEYCNSIIRVYEPIPSALVMEAIRSPKAAVSTRATMRNFPENGIPHSHRLGNLKTYTYMLASFQLYLGLAKQQIIQQSKTVRPSTVRDS